MFSDNDAVGTDSSLQNPGWNGGTGKGSLCASARSERSGGYEGRGCRRLGCSDDRAPPPPRQAPALTSRHLPPPALLMLLLLADMDVVNQVRAPAPRTESAAFSPLDSEVMGRVLNSRDPIPDAGAGRLWLARGGRGAGEKKQRALCRSEGYPHCRSGGCQKPRLLLVTSRRAKGSQGLGEGKGKGEENEIKTEGLHMS